MDIATDKLLAAISALPTPPPPHDRLEFALFAENEKRSARDAGKIHKGHGWLHYRLTAASGITPEALLQRFEGAAAPGLELRFQLAKEQPLAAEEIEAKRKREEERQKVREHKRRNRVRKVYKRIERLEEIVKEIEAATAAPIRSMYAQFEDLPGGGASAGERLAEDAAASNAAATTSSSAAAEDEIDWSLVPPVIDPLNWYFRPKDLEADAQPAPRETTSKKKASQLDFLVVDEERVGEEPAEGLEPDVPRGLRKRAQVESFYLVIQRLLRLRRARGDVKRARPLIIDYGCGSGALTLSLAWLMKGESESE